MTLVEVMIALGILAIVALALVQLTYFTRATAEDDVHQNTALTLAQGYLEQICDLPYSSTTSPQGLIQIADDNKNSVTFTLTNSSGTPITTITNNSSVTEQVNLDQDSSGKTFPMTFQFTPVLVDLSKKTTGATGVEVTIYFKATYNLGSPRTFQSSVSTVRSAIETN